MAIIKTGRLDYSTANKIPLFKWLHSNPDSILSKFYITGVCKILIRLRNDNKNNFESPVAWKKYWMHMGGLIDLVGYLL